MIVHRVFRWLPLQRWNLNGPSATPKRDNWWNSNSSQNKGHLGLSFHFFVLCPMVMYSSPYPTNVTTSARTNKILIVKVPLFLKINNGYIKYLWKKNITNISIESFKHKVKVSVNIWAASVTSLSSEWINTNQKINTSSKFYSVKHYNKCNKWKQFLNM